MGRTRQVTLTQRRYSAPGTLLDVAPNRVWEGGVSREWKKGEKAAYLAAIKRK